MTVVMLMRMIMLEGCAMVMCVIMPMVMTAVVTISTTFGLESFIHCIDL